MSNNYLNVFIPVISLAINVVTQVVSFKVYSKLGLLNSIFLGFFAGFIFLGSLFISDFMTELILLKYFCGIFSVNLITYICFAYCYFHFINLGETARRIRILRELKESPIGLSMDEILMRYNAKDIVKLRIARLLRNGQIMFKNGKYYIGNSTVLIMARLLEVLKLILLGRKSCAY
ncbi:MAG: hypothetical protein Q8O13_03355 [Candidatus Omnitrophota bacterium]|nr:hypothetical protein [Candidatus Omnitrophota bacterium]